MIDICVDYTTRNELIGIIEKLRVFNTYVWYNKGIKIYVPKKPIDGRNIMRLCMLGAYVLPANQALLSYPFYEITDTGWSLYGYWPPSKRLVTPNKIYKLEYSISERKFLIKQTN